MKILFLYNNANRNNGSSENVIQVIMNQLSKKHEISVLSKVEEHSLSHRIIRKNRICYYFFSPISYYNEIYEYMVKRSGWGKKTEIGKAGFLLMHPSIFFKKLFFKCESWDDFERSYKRELSNLLRKNKYDVIIGLSTPYSIVRALAGVRTEGKKVIYELDPYFTNYMVKNKKKALKEEKRVLSKIDLAIMTDLIYNENQTNELYTFKEKMKWLNYPNIRRIPLLNVSEEIKFDAEKINCCFVGNFYDEIRNPQLMLELFYNMKNPDIVLHIIGGGSAQDIVMHYKKIMGNRLILHGVKPLKTALYCMQKADILVSLNNNVKNQLPGKIFDYISVGKPILNFYQISECQSLKYMERYPLVLNIDLKRKQDVMDIEDFCIDNKGKCVPYEKIEKLFFANTAQVVGKDIQDMLEMLLEKEDK